MVNMWVNISNGHSAYSSFLNSDLRMFVFIYKISRYFIVVLGNLTWVCAIIDIKINCFKIEICFSLIKKVSLKFTRNSLFLSFEF